MLDWLIDLLAGFLLAVAAVVAPPEPGIVPAGFAGYDAIRIPTKGGLTPADFCIDLNSDGAAAPIPARNGKATPAV